MMENAITNNSITIVNYCINKLVVKSGNFVTTITEKRIAMKKIPYLRHRANQDQPIKNAILWEIFCTPSP